MATTEQYGTAFRHRLCKRARELGATNYAIARAVGVSAATVTNWMNGSRHPSVMLAARLADALGVSLDWLLDRDSRGYGGADA